MESGKEGALRCFINIWSLRQVSVLISLTFIFLLLSFSVRASGEEDTVSWNKTFNYVGTDTVSSVAIDSNGNIYVGGERGTDWWITKFNSSGGEDTINWNKTIIRTGADDLNSIAVDASGNVYAVGYANNLIAADSGRDWLIKKFNSSGSEDVTSWNKTFSGHTSSTNDNAYSVAVDSNGSVYVVGRINQAIAAGAVNWWIKKFNSSGSEDLTNWNKTFTSADPLDPDDVAYSVAIDSIDDVYVVGHGNNLTGTTSSDDWWLKKFNSSGTEDVTNWNKNFTSVGRQDDIAYSVVVDINRNVYVAGQGVNFTGTGSVGSGTDWWIKKFNSSGTEDVINWNKTFTSAGGALQDIAYSVVVDGNRTVYVVGYGINLTGTGSGGSDADWWLKKFNTSGTEDVTNWNKNFTSAGTNSDVAYSAAVASNGNVFVAGSGYNFTGTGDGDAWIKSFTNNVPNVTFLLPALNSVFNVTQVIEIAANVTDIDSISRVIANVTVPNGTVQSLTLSNSTGAGDKFNISYTIPNLQGVYTITIFANDTLGVVNNTQTTNFTANDITPPNITLNFLNNFVNASNFSIRSNNQTFNVSAIDIASSVQRIYFWFDNGTGTDFNATADNQSGEWITTYNVSTLAEGKQGVRIVANDTFGNTNNSFIINFSVDFNSPNVSTATLNGNPGNASNFSLRTNNQTFNFTIFDSFTEVQNVHFWFDNGTGQDFNVTAVNQSGQWIASYNVSALAEGKQGLRVRANDTVGNLNNTALNFTVDFTTPNVTLNFLNNPVNGSNFSIRSSNQTFNASVSDTLTEISNVYFWFDNGTSADFNVTAINISGNWHVNYNVSLLAEGKQGVRIVANDSSGNVNNTASINFTIDLTTPNVTLNFLNNPVNGSNYSFNSAATANVTFNTSIFDALTEVSNVYFWFDNGTSADFNVSGINISGAWYVSYNLSLLVEGRQGVRIVANDSAGNINNTASINFTIDFNSPNVSTSTLNGNPGNASNFSIRTNNQTFNFTIFDSLTVVQSVYFWFDNGTGQDFNVTAVNQSGEWVVSYNVSGLAEGRQGLRVRANDTVGNLNNTALNFTVDFTTPNVTLNFLNNAVNGSNYSFSSVSAANVTFNTSIFDALTEVSNVYFWFDNGTSQDFNVSGINISGAWYVSYNLSLLTEGRQGVSVVANDSAGNINKTSNINFTIDFSSPNVSVVTVNGNPGNASNFSIRTNNQTFNFTIFDSFTEVQNVYFWFDNGTGQDFNVTAVNQSGEWIASYNVSALAEGKQGLRVRANDTVGNLNNTALNFTVDLTVLSVTLNFLNNPVNGSNFSIRSGNQTFNASVSDTLTEISNVYFWFDNGTSQDFNITAINISGNWHVNYNVSLLAEGRQGVRIVANDSSGNINNTASINFTIDFNAPNVTFNTGRYTNTSGTLVINATVNDTLTTVQTVRLNISNSSNGGVTILTLLVTGNTYNTSWIHNNGSYPDGDYNLSLLANDTVNNLNNSATIKITVDNTVPTASVSCTSPVSVGDVATCTCSGSDTGSGLETAIFSDGTTSEAGSTSSSGTKVSSVCTATDKAGNIATATGTYEVNAVAGSSGSSGGSSSTPPPESTSPPPPPPAVTVSEPTLVTDVATPEEVTAAITGGELTVSIESTPAATESTSADSSSAGASNSAGSAASTGGGSSRTIERRSITTQQEVVVALENKGDKTIILDEPRIIEHIAPLEHEEKIKSLVQQELGQQSHIFSPEALQQRVEQETITIALIEENNIQPILRKTATLLPFFKGRSLTGIENTRERISGTELQAEVLNPEKIQLGPGESIEKVFFIKRGITAKPKPITLVFTSAGTIVTQKEVSSEEPLIIGTAIDVDRDTKTFDIYLTLPAQEEVQEYWLEVEIMGNSSHRNLVTGNAVKSVLYTDIFGPYRNSGNAAIFAQQLSYDDQKYSGPAMVKTRIYQGLQVVAENQFEVDLGGTALSGFTAPSLGLYLLLGIVCFIPFVIGIFFHSWRKR